MHSVEYTPQTLTDAQKAQARENIGAASEIFLITITSTTTDGTTTYSADKTYDEIKQAYDDGKTLVAFYGAYCYFKGFYGNSAFNFIGIGAGYDPNSYSTVLIMSDAVLVSKLGIVYTYGNNVMNQVNMNEAPTTDMQIATKKYVDDNKTTVPTNVSAFTNDANYATTTEVNKKLSLSGGTMTGDIDMGQNSLNNVGEIRMPKGEGGAYITPAGTPTAPSLEIMGLNGDKPVEITGIADPTSDGSAANKSYVDTGLAGKANSSHNHSASNITSGTLPITRGGTNASTAAAARTNLGFSYGTSVPTSAPDTGNGAVFFCQDSGAPLSIANGGTGGATQDAARTNLGLPTQDNRIVTICNGTRLVSGSNITITLDPTEAKKYRAILILLGTPLGGNYGNMYDSFTFPLNPDTWSFRFFNYTSEGQDWQCAKANLSSDWTTFTITAVSGSTNHPCWCYLM